MSAPRPAEPQPTSPHVTSRAVAANLRVLSVRFDDGEYDRGFVKDFTGRIDQIVGLFLEKHWAFPRRSVQIVPLSYLLFPGPDDEAFAETVEKLTTQLERHLFGEGVHIKCLLGAEDDMTGLAKEPDQIFLAAHEAVVAELPDAAQPARVRVDPEDAWKRELRLFAGYDAPRKAVLCYIASMSRGAEPAAQVLYHDSARVCGGRMDAFEFAALRFAIARVMAKLETGAVSYCLVPLSYETLVDRKRREAYLKESGELPEELRRYIVPSVFGGPLGPSSSLILDLIGALRASFANVDWQTRSCTIELDPMKHAGLFAVTLALPHGPERAIELGRLPAFVRRATALRIRPGVTGLANAAEVGLAISARAHFLSGPAVSRAMPDLTPQLRVAVEGLPLKS